MQAIYQRQKEKKRSKKVDVKQILISNTIVVQHQTLSRIHIFICLFQTTRFFLKQIHH